MSAPIIGITCNRFHNTEQQNVLSSLGEAYIQSVQRAGGAPVLLPANLTENELSVIFPHLDGLLLTGGGDIDPALFNGIPHPRIYGIEAGRDFSEFWLTRQAVRLGLPFLGICRGIQVINVALGGTLFTHVPDQLPGALRHDCHPDHPRDYLAHDVQVQPGSRLEKIIGNGKVMVNSMHHQGVDQTASVLRPVAWSPDGLIEAVELEGHPFGLGVQWHPECLPDLPNMQALFRELVGVAKK